MGVKEIVLGIPVTKSGNFEEYEKSIEWYVNVLGFNLIWKKGIASLKLANGQEILLFGEVEGMRAAFGTQVTLSGIHIIQYILQLKTSSSCNLI